MQNKVVIYQGKNGEIAEVAGVAGVVQNYLGALKYFASFYARSVAGSRRTGAVYV